MKYSHLFQALCVAGLLAASQSAMASTITANYLGSADFGSGQVGYGNGSVWPNPSHPVSGPVSMVGVGVGGDQFSNASKTPGLTSTFNTWCVDINHWLTGSYIYNVGGTTELDAVFGSSRVNDLQTLADERYSKLHTQADSAAFQLATWAIMFGTELGGKYNLNDATFKTSNGITGGALATSWLNSLGGTTPNTGNYKITYLYDNDNRNPTQDLVVFTPSPVPLPAAAWLFGSAMLGFISLSNRRKV